MECPNCGNVKTKIIETRKVEMNTYRQHLCLNCKNRFYTEESIIDNEEGRFYCASYKKMYRIKKSLSGNN